MSGRMVPEYEADEIREIIEKPYRIIYKCLILRVTRLGFEPKTHSLEGCCSIQLSYRALPACLRMQKYGNSQNKKNI